MKNINIKKEKIKFLYNRVVEKERKKEGKGGWYRFWKRESCEIKINFVKD